MAGTMRIRRALHVRVWVSLRKSNDRRRGHQASFSFSEVSGVHCVHLFVKGFPFAKKNQGSPGRLWVVFSRLSQPFTGVHIDLLVPTFCVFTFWFHLKIEVFG